MDYGSSKISDHTIAKLVDRGISIDSESEFSKAEWSNTERLKFCDCQRLEVQGGQAIEVERFLLELESHTDFFK